MLTHKDRYTQTHTSINIYIRAHTTHTDTNTHAYMYISLTRSKFVQQLLNTVGTHKSLHHTIMKYITSFQVLNFICITVKHPTPTCTVKEIGTPHLTFLRNPIIRDT